MEEAELKIRKPDGSVVGGVKVEFETVKEEWNEYVLSDGTKLFVKLVLVDVARANELSPIGEPIYQILTQNIVKAKASKKAVQEVEELAKRRTTAYHG